LVVLVAFTSRKAPRGQREATTIARKEHPTMRDLSKLLTSEMTAEEWKEFRRQWIADYAASLVVECGTSVAQAKEIAPVRFEDYCGQEGWTGRDEQIMVARERTTS
jgi:hypothetical protein